MPGRAVRTMAEISPSILAADFAHLGEEVAAAERGGARMLHVDVMDGHFVPNISLGVPIVKSLRNVTDLVLDCHLMVSNPERYLDPFIDAGARMVTVHQEACPHLGRAVSRIHELGAAAGVALNPATPLSTLEEILPELDLVLVMSVHPGFGGQSLIPASIEKISRLKAIRTQRGLGFRIQVDGGINTDNVATLSEAGCDILVAGTSIFRTGNIPAAFRTLAAQANQPAFANA